MGADCVKATPTFRLQRSQICSGQSLLQPFQEVKLSRGQVGWDKPDRSVQMGKNQTFYSVQCSGQSWRWEAYLMPDMQ